MAEFSYFTGPMDSGKSTLALTRAVARATLSDPLPFGRTSDEDDR